MKNLLLLLFLVPTILMSQKFEYNVVTDLNYECNCKSSLKIKKNKVIIKYKKIRKTIKISNSKFIENKKLHILNLVENKYGIKKITISEAISIISYNDTKKRDVQFLNIYGR
jgi:hypothetical protein